MNYESALRRKKCISNIIAYASKSRNFDKKTNPQTISIIARRTRALVVFVYALHGIDSYALAPPCPDTRSMPITRFTDVLVKQGRTVHRPS